MWKISLKTCYNRHYKNKNPTGNKFVKVRKKSVRLKNRVAAPEIKIESKVGMGANNRGASTPRTYDDKFYYPGCDND